MPQVSIYWLNTYTGKDPRTIKKRLANLPKDKHGKYDSGAAFEAIYAGQMTELEGEFVSTPEAVRRLTLAKKAQIDLDMEIKRGQRIPIDDVKEIVGRAFMSVAATLKANRDKVLSEQQINDIFAMLRDSENKLVSKNGGRHI
jgi:hypothetical protein